MGVAGALFAAVGFGFVFWKPPAINMESLERWVWGSIGIGVGYAGLKESICSKEPPRPLPSLAPQGPANYLPAAPGAGAPAGPIPPHRDPPAPRPAPPPPREVFPWIDDGTVEEAVSLDRVRSQDARLKNEWIRSHGGAEYTTFDLNLNGPPREWNNDFHHFPSPVINRYSRESNLYGSLLARIEITPKMASRLPSLPREVRSYPVQAAYILIWGDLPPKPEAIRLPDYGYMSDLQYQLPTLLFGGSKDGERTIEPIQLGLFTKDADSTGIASNEGTHGHAAAINALGWQEYDIHDTDPCTSDRGVFTVDREKPVHSFTLKIRIHPLPNAPNPTL